MVRSNSILWTILSFIGIIFFSELVVLKEVWLPITGGEFSFKNFLIYNFTVKVIGYILKFLILYLFFKFVFLVFDIERKIQLFRILILAEIVYILVLKGYLLFYYYFIDNTITKKFLSTYESKASIVSLFSNNFKTFKHMVGFVTVFDIFYILFLVFMFSEELKISFCKSFKITGLSYLALLLFIGVIKTFLNF